MSKKLLVEEKRYLLNNLDELRRKYPPGQYLVIKGSKVHKSFRTQEDAVDFGIEQFGRGPFLVRSVDDPDPEPLVIPSLLAGIPLTMKP